MYQYQDLMRLVLEHGEEQLDRTGTGTKSIFGHQMRFNLQDGFPLLTTKKLHTKSILHELIWMLKGETNIKYLNDNGVRIWNEWADENGDLGRVYGAQWRDYRGFVTTVENEIIPVTHDQITNLIFDIKNKPTSRRHIVTAWNPNEVDNVGLPPCHCFIQFRVSNGKLDCQLYQRSADIFLGVPFNIASYAILTHIIAELCNLEVGTFIHTLGDAHIYSNHFEQCKLQLQREPLPMCDLFIDSSSWETVDDVKFEHFKFEGYQSHPHIAGEVSV